MTIRHAAPEDFAACARLLAELGRPAPTPDTEAALREVYERHVARADTASLVAEAEGAVIGFLSLEFRERLNQTQPQAWIPDLIVTEGSRGLGAGRALLRRAFELAEERGCWSVTLESGYQRTVAHQLYKSAGMQEAGFYFVLPL
jgi:GNAT superfamily N-acetyltransferase